MKKSISIPFLLILLLSNSYSVVLGQTSFVNFTRQQYAGGTQNWAFEQDSLGCLYVANNEGLLTFDGTRWTVYPTPKRTIIRQIIFSKDGKLYAGGQDEIGYYQPNESGKLEYHSLIESLALADRQFADIWNIALFQDAVFFRSFSKIIKIKGTQASVYKTSSEWKFLGFHENNLFAQDAEKGLLLYKNNDWQTLLPAKNLPPGISITSIVPFQSGSLLLTKSHGLFKLSGSNLSRFDITGVAGIADIYFTSSSKLSDGQIILGTYDDGLLKLDKNGVLIEKLTRSDGLKNDNVKCIFKDKRSNIWLGLEDGISFYNQSAGISHLNPTAFNGASGYSAAVTGKTLYLALANGVYFLPIENNTNGLNLKSSVTKLADGLSWNVTLLDERLFVGGDNGFYEIKNKGIKKLDDATGYWTFRAIDLRKDTLNFVTGSYTGITIFDRYNETMAKKVDLSYLNTSARYVEYDPIEKIIWVSHPYRGVYRIHQPENSVKLFTEKEGLPSILDNHVFKVKGKILMATLKGIYSYNTKTENFEPSKEYIKTFNDLSIRYLKDDLSGNLWFVHEKNVGVVDSKTGELYYLPELDNKIVSGFEHILPIDSAHILIGGLEGFYLVNFSEYKKHKKVPTVSIRNVTATYQKDSILFDGFYTENMRKMSTISYKWNSLHFEFSAPYFDNVNTVKYSYRLEGFESDWCNWTKKTEKNYTNIPPGDYQFQVKALNNMQQESTIATYSFTIKPPWYKTTLTRVFFFILLIVILRQFYKMQEKKFQKQQDIRFKIEQKKHEEEQKMLEYKHQLELGKTEKEIIQLKNEKLEAELASTAMNLVQKKEFMVKLKEELSRLNKSGHLQIDSVEFKKILRKLTAEDKLDDEWEQFSIHFNKIHGDFLILLKAKYPDLKSHELKLCAYLRMNLSTKEMAQLLSISVRGVEISRYRLRKKLQVPPKVDLFQFLFDLDTATRSQTGAT
jgi:ligand-binding sensor domain-containing protein/DNA-binding CsgD family transcriptional regulator